MRGSWRPNRTVTYWPLLLWPSASLSRSPGLLNWRARGPSSLLDPGFLYRILCPKTPISKLLNRGSRGPHLPGAGFLYHILSPTLRFPNSIGGPEGPFCWVLAFSTTSCLQTLRSPKTNWLPVFTELYNSSIAHSISPHNWPSECVTSAVFGRAYLIVIERK